MKYTDVLAIKMGYKPSPLPQGERLDVTKGKKGHKNEGINKIIKENYRNRNVHYTAEGTRPSDVARVILSSCFVRW